MAAAFDRATGTAMELTGKVTRNRRLQTKGKVRKVAGKVKRTGTKVRRKAKRTTTKARVRRRVR